MRDPKFTAAQFTPTQFYTAEEKAKFFNHFVRFVRSGFKETLFHKGFYKHLSGMFGHIAHFNQHGFYATWFSSPTACREFLERTAGWPIYGEPEYTFCDCERALRQWVRDSGLVEGYRAAARLALETAERAELARLSAKYACIPAQSESSAVTSLPRTCPSCEEVTDIFDNHEIDETWQQWQCPCCGSWVDKDTGGVVSHEEAEVAKP